MAHWLGYTRSVEDLFMSRSSYVRLDASRGADYRGWLDSLPKPLRQLAIKEVGGTATPRATTLMHREKLHALSFERLDCKDDMRMRVMNVVAKILEIQLDHMDHMHANVWRSKKRVVPTVKTDRASVGMLWVECMDWMRDDGDVEVKKAYIRNMEDDIKNAKRFYILLVEESKNEENDAMVKEGMSMEAKKMLFRVKKATEVKKEWEAVLAVHLLKHVGDSKKGRLA